ncbi:MAG: phosphoribosylformylglycinamidine cyclo-ligase [Candidatus Altiarchaeota archaeon]|nr:phosphoribosylformylglycinamidine cyclo-ligase [Candidatus Altiarchaeota archaeon]
MTRKDVVKPDTYAKAGVDIRREDRAIKGIINWVSKTFKFREGKIGAVMRDVGTFANVIDIGEYALAMCTDGVGSKVLVAQELEKYDTVGIDMVAMNVNDLICLGAEPIAMVDYLAMEQTNDKMAKEISIGLYEGARQAEIAIVGGETASLPEVVKGCAPGRGFDLAGTALGIVKKDRIITGEKIELGDVVLSLESNGIHSNGLTLARKVLPKSMWMSLIAPTRIYVKEIMELVRKFEIHGLANITGGGLLNLVRLTKYGFTIDKLPEAPMVFKKIQELGGISDEEMYRTFNMGVGCCVITSKSEADKIIKEYGEKYRIREVGKVVEESGVRIVKGGKQITIERTMY